MKYRFNNEEYKKSGHNQTGLGALVYDIFKYYLKNNSNKTYKEIQDIFNPLHKEFSGKNSNKKVIFNKNDFDEWYEKASADTKRDERYFSPPINYNNEKLYFTTQWGNENIINFIDFARKNLTYNIQDLKENTKEENMKINLKTKNIMLYGAPGVGKTYNYKKLVSLIESGKYNENDIFKSIIENQDLDINIDETFENIKKEDRLEFVTFHQSYSYEDFIEGFRPQDDGAIKLEDGIFKKLCEKARVNLENSQIKESDKLLDLDELIQKFTNYVQDSLDKEETFFIDKKITIENINDRGAFLLGGNIKTDTQRLTPDIIKRDYQLYKNKEITKYEDIKPTRESKSSYHGNARYYFMLYKKIEEFEKTLNFNTIKKQKEEQKNYYIVIDEINRGNISKIFGELITLIEEDKRGKKEYEVTLPYSKAPFLIPENLYIIATMNSTDKSIATIDIALRRRFTFLKMKPNIDLVSEIAKELFKNLNDFIEKTLGEDYKLGHSYFMNIKDEEELEFLKEYKIKPLLEEYFYGDRENYNKALEKTGVKQ